jgi:hypothetical protein
MAAIKLFGVGGLRLLHGGDRRHRRSEAARGEEIRRRVEALLVFEPGFFGMA